MPHLLRTRWVFVDAPVFLSAWQMVDKKAQYIISISPGDTMHYCTALSALSMTAEELVQCFWSHDNVGFTKQFLFDAFTCLSDPRDPLAQMLGLTEKTATFNQVIIHVIKSEQIVVLFTTSQGEAYTASMRVMSKNDGPVIRNLQKLSVKAAAAYREHYNNTKTKLLYTAAELYAPLRNKYEQVLGKNIVALSA